MGEADLRKAAIGKLRAETNSTNGHLHIGPTTEIDWDLCIWVCRWRSLLGDKIDNTQDGYSRVRRTLALVACEPSAAKLTEDDIEFVRPAFVDGGVLLVMSDQRNIRDEISRQIKLVFGDTVGTA